MINIQSTLSKVHLIGGVVTTTAHRELMLLNTKNN